MPEHCKCFPGKSSCPICRGTGWVTVCDRCDGCGMKENKICMRCAGRGKMLANRPAVVIAGAHDKRGGA